jgi:hypothetical protein
VTVSNLVVPVAAGPLVTSDPAVVRARHRRLEAEAAAAVARVLPRLETLGLSWSMQRLEVCPSARGRRRALDTLLRLAARRQASVVSLRSPRAPLSAWTPMRSRIDSDFGPWPSRSQSSA